jgi:hypothetical protein
MREQRRGTVPIGGGRPTPNMKAIGNDARMGKRFFGRNGNRIEKESGVLVVFASSARNV